MTNSWEHVPGCNMEHAPSQGCSTWPVPAGTAIDFNDDPEVGTWGNTWRRIRRRRRGRAAITIFVTNFALSFLFWLGIELTMASCRSRGDCSAAMALYVPIFFWFLGEFFVYMPLQIFLLVTAADPKEPD